MRFHRHISKDVQDVGLSTTSSLDVQCVSLSNAYSLDEI
jgi:hypothetical protein